MDRDEKERRARAYVRKLANPYAALQVDGYPDAATDDSTDAPVQLALAAAEMRSKPSVPSLNEMQNPYASLDETYQQHSTRAHSKITPANKIEQEQGTISKRAFQAACRRIFSGYMPVFQRTRLRQHYRNFITRNESRAPTERFLLIRELEKYDLSKIRGIRPQFNRERQSLTEEKLMSIERTVCGD